MKKNFKNPELIVTTFSCENVVTGSEVTAEQSIRNNETFIEKISGGQVTVAKWHEMQEILASGF